MKFKDYYLDEEAYPGNIGFQEMAFFYKRANALEIRQMEEIIQRNDWRQFVELIHRVLGVRLKESLSEEFFNAFKHRNGETDEVYKNPTMSEFKKLQMEARQRYGVSPLSIKCLAQGAGNIYIWIGEFLHEDMSKKINLFGGRLIPCYLEAEDRTVYISTIMMHGHGFTSYNYREDEDIIVHELQTSTALKRIMGSFKLATV